MAQKVDQFSVICTRWLVGRARRNEPVKEELPPFFLNPVSHRREIGGRTCGHTRGRCKEKEGLFLGEEEEESQRSLLLREKEDHSSGSGR